MDSDPSPPTALPARNRPGDPREEEFDDLFNYDAAIDDAFRDVDTDLNVSAKTAPVNRKSGHDSALGLGIDEEIKIKKKRQPIAKLDESRLLSQAGIPKLRRTAKERLNLKGKGHEYADAARLLNFYQLWLDDLFSRAKFADGLAIIEKLGHSKSMNVRRKEWIDEGKYKSSDDQEREPKEPQNKGSKPSHQDAGTEQPAPGLFEPDSPPEQQEQPRTEAEDETVDTVPSIFGNGKQPGYPKPTVTEERSNNLFFTDSEDDREKDEDNGPQPPEEHEDELDAIIAEHGLGDASKGAPTIGLAKLADRWDDEMEAMDEVDAPW